MSGYRVEVASSAARELQRLPNQAQGRIVAAINGLAENPRPRGVEKLRGYQDLFRIRVGQYRVVYRVADPDHLVDIVRIRTRADAYRR